MKTLILTCNTGQGHNSSAAAIKEIYAENSDLCETADTLSFLSKQASKIVEKCFTGIYRHIPKAFDSMYSHSESDNHTINPMDSAVNILKIGCKRLYNYIISNEFDSIICVHLFPAIMVTHLKEKYGLNIKTALLTTDYTCYPFTEKTDLDLYFMPHADLADEFSEIIKDKNKLIDTGIPIRRDFLSLPDKKEARKQLGLSCQDKIVFIMGGSMGCGPMEELVCKISETADQNTKLLVSCGTNKALLKSLEKRNLQNADVFSFSHDVPVIMAASDLFITKPGGISSTEASASGLPTIVMNVIGACETPNFNFFTQHNYFYAATTVDETAALCNSLLSDPETLKERSELLKRDFNRDSAAMIYNAIAN